MPVKVADAADAGIDASVHCCPFQWRIFGVAPQRPVAQMSFGPVPHSRVTSNSFELTCVVHDEPFHW
jgi:hypothetical protein